MEINSEGMQMPKIRVLAKILPAALLIMIYQVSFGQEIPQKEETMTASEYLKAGDDLFKTRDYEKARESYLKVLETSSLAELVSERVEALSQIARTYLIAGDKEQARTWLNKAQDVARPENPLGWSRYLGVKGRLAWQDNYLAEATATFMEMYDYCHARNLSERAIDAAHMVAITGNPDQQIEWGKKGIAEAETGKITSWLGPLWNNLGYTYESLERYGEAVKAYREAREYHGQYGDERNRLVADWALGHAFRLKGDIDSAEIWIKPLPAWCEKIGETEFLGWSHKELGEIALARGLKDSARNHFSLALTQLENSGMADWDPQGWAELKAKVSDSTGAGEK
jgi:tetratricopeptide (TPR) repeat protein